MLIDPRQTLYEPAMKDISSQKTLSKGSSAWAIVPSAGELQRLRSECGATLRYWLDCPEAMR